MKRMRKKRPPSPVLRTTWNDFIRLPEYWEQIKQQIINGAKPNNNSVLSNTNDL